MEGALMRARNLRARSVVAVLGLLAAALAAVATSSAASAGAASPSQEPRPARPAYVPPIRHVFVINIENKAYDELWGGNTADSADTSAPFLARHLRRKGVLLNSYYATAHESLPNYIAQISGQAPNIATQTDCQTYSAFTPTGPAVAPQQAVGTGCVYPTSVRTLPRQLSRAGLHWRGYMQQMRTPCVHPAIGQPDPTQHATPHHNYAVRHDPFMYFATIVDNPQYCQHHVRPLEDLVRNLRHVRTTPNLSYITPDLCRDGHDDPCASGSPGGLTQVDRFMRQWVPRILHSPAYLENGMLVITADEADGTPQDTSACCGELTGPNTARPGLLGPGGGKVGALVISRFTTPNTWSTTPYNHYSLLGSLEEIFRLPKIGMARQAGLPVFGLDVYNNGWWNR
jgi:phosphatidylinositol-3-phosphatase